VFQRPLGEWPDGKGVPPAVPPNAVPRPTLPRLVWVIDEVPAARAFEAVLKERFADALIALVELRKELRRSMRPDA
jgi:hypothetical protein